MQLLGSNEAGPPSSIGITSIWSSKSSSWPQAPATRNWWAACNSMVVPLLAGTATTTSSALGCHCFFNSSAVSVWMCRCTGHNFQKICNLQGMVLKDSPGPRHHMARKPECSWGVTNRAFIARAAAPTAGAAKTKRWATDIAGKTKGCCSFAKKDGDTLLGVWPWSVAVRCRMLPPCAFCLYWYHRVFMAGRNWCHLDNNHIYIYHIILYHIIYVTYVIWFVILGEIYRRKSALTGYWISIMLRQFNMGWDYWADWTTEKEALQLQTIDVPGDNVPDKPEWH